MYSLEVQHHNLILGAIVVSGVILAGYALHFLLFRFILRRGNAATPGERHVLRHFRVPARWLFLTACALLALPYLPLPQQAYIFLHHTIQLCFIATGAWVAIACLDAVEDVLLRRYDITQEDNLSARRVHTQMRVLRRVCIIFIVVVTLGLMLYSFDNQLAKYGAGLLASAGIASLVLATAAKSSASNLLAGLQIAFTEPIRIDDQVEVEGQSGRVEEITSTYVVVRTWDFQRLIVPLNTFIDKAFQNWTRTGTAVAGKVFLYMDYSVPVRELREEFLRVLAGSPLWDGRMGVLQVSDLTDRAMELRGDVSARNTSDLWNLRCLVREELIAFVQAKYPNGLPTRRVRNENGDGTIEEDLPGKL
ncbi:MAG TPA: mechanosensitive ion channel domain-containing protein [Acidobacteriaceae bacterium]|jgi:small-conductance mechanosensitive channel|nr:mechanosensitive ion channel domain-containing protein [Acidobacteriaceae bacterium]